MRKKLEITPYDGAEFLKSEELVRLCIAEVRKMGIPEYTASAIDDGKRACALYGLSLAAAGLANEEVLDEKEA